MSAEEVLAHLDLADDDPRDAANRIIAACAADIENEARKMQRSSHATHNEAANAAEIARELQKRILVDDE